MHRLLLASLVLGVGFLVIPARRRRAKQTLQEKIASGEPTANAGIMPAAAANDPSRVVVVEIEGLQPGVNYFWRRTPGGPVVRCQAPVCPSDSRSRR